MAHPDDTPLGDTTVPSVEDQALESVEAVDEGGSGEKVVPAERFNGLQRKYQADRTAWESERASLLEQVEAKQTNTGDEQVSTVDPRIDALLEHLEKSEMDRARAEALLEHPELKEVADLIVGGSPEEVKAIADTLADRFSRMGFTQPPAQEVQEAETEANESGTASDDVDEAPVNGLGGNSAPDTTSIDERVNAAREARDFQSWWAATQERGAIVTADVS
jgi:hypothetical protein